MNVAIEHTRARGCAWMDLGTSEDVVVARALYESLAFINREGKNGPIKYVYELDLLWLIGGRTGFRGCREG